MENIQLYNEDNLEVMKRLPDESIDVICIDPPYLYLKNQKLERPFDEHKFFSECARLLTKKGFVVMFGRGESFYRWNTLLENTRLYKGEYVIIDKKVTVVNDTDVKVSLTYNGVDISEDKEFKKIFTFKEEIIWDKRYTSSPVMNLSRVHETISIFSKEKGVINLSKIPYIEQKLDFTSIHQDLKRIKSGLNNPKSLSELLQYVEDGSVNYTEVNKSNYTATLQSRIKAKDRAVKTIESITDGLREKSVISLGREHYSTIHPTQKPVRLLERLLKLVIPMKSKKVIIADFFSGSASCGEAVYNLQYEFPDIEFEFIGCEIDQEYFEKGKERIEKLQPLQPELFQEVI